jgi:L-fuconate dehydratase
VQITGFDTHDVRFPTSRTLDGSDAMNPNPDYAMAYLTVLTDAPEEARGNGFVFTIGRGNDVQLAAIRALEPLVVGLEVEELLDDMGALSRRLVGESQFRWLGPEKGVMHMAIGAVVNALWDLKAKLAGLPLWRLLAQMSPEDIVALVDFRYLSDALTSGEALEILKAGANGREHRAEVLVRDGFPAYTTSAGWLGYSDERIELLCSEAVDAGFTQVKLKVGGQLEDDRRRCRIARAAIGDNIGLAVDANQVWDVGRAIEWVKRLAEFELAWVEEPTSPDDILGTAAIRAGVQPVPIAAGEHVANRVVFKQLLQAKAIDVMQIDACRVAGVNENIANILLAAKFGVPVCPHTGGVGLCELAQHLAMFDYVAVSGSLAGRRIEWIDHLHEHFVEPAAVDRGRYRAALGAGASVELHASSVAEYSFPYGPVWRAAEG